MNGRLFAVVLIGMEAAAGGAYSAAPVAVSSGMPLSVWTNKAGRVVHDFGQDAFGWAEALDRAGPVRDGIRGGDRADGSRFRQSLCDCFEPCRRDACSGTRHLARQHL